MPSASLVSQPQGARQWKVGTGLTLIEIEKLGVGVQVTQVSERRVSVTTRQIAIPAEAI